MEFDCGVVVVVVFGVVFVVFVVAVDDVLFVVDVVEGGLVGLLFLLSGEFLLAMLFL